MWHVVIQLKIKMIPHTHTQNIETFFFFLTRTYYIDFRVSRNRTATRRIFMVNHSLYIFFPSHTHTIMHQ